MSLNRSETFSLRYACCSSETACSASENTTCFLSQRDRIYTEICFLQAQNTFLLQDLESAAIFPASEPVGASDDDSCSEGNDSSQVRVTLPCRVAAQTKAVQIAGFLNHTRGIRISICNTSEEISRSSTGAGGSVSASII